MDEDFVVAFLDEHYHSGDILERAQMMLAEREAGEFFFGKFRN